MAKIVSTLIKDVWLGTNIENVHVMNRIDHLRAVPAAIRFPSYEPLIGAVDLSDIHGAIVGDESGRSVRPIRPSIWVQLMPPGLVTDLLSTAWRRTLAR